MRRKLFDRISKVLLILLLLLAVLITTWAYPILRQEDNPIQILIGIVQLNLKGLDAYEYDTNTVSKHNQYITRSKDGFDVIKDKMEVEGWTLKEQFGSGYFFVSSTDKKDSMNISSVQFTRFYKLWLIPMEAFER